MHVCVCMCVYVSRCVCFFWVNLCAFCADVCVFFFCLSLFVYKFAFASICRLCNYVVLFCCVYLLV